jgi:hypothetical protein
MRVISLITSLIVIFTTSCDLNREQDDSAYSGNIEELIEKNIAKISINTGIAGTLLKKEGNCMPMIGATTSCKSYPVSRIIQIYEYTNQNEVEGWGPLFDSVNSKLITQCDADQEGFFQVTIDPGKYSVFICEKDKFYANSFDGQGGIYPLTVKSDSISIIKLTLDYAVY